MAARDNTNQSQFGTQLLHASQAAMNLNHLTGGAVGDKLTGLIGGGGDAAAAGADAATAASAGAEGAAGAAGVGEVVAEAAPLLLL
jgi:hypothetical protein